jgi:hypothetical protein
MKPTKQIMTRTKAVFALAATLMSTTAISTAAFAGDNKVYPGSLCDVQTPASRNTVSRAAGQLLNNGSSSVNVHCPVIRDNTGSADNGVGPLAFVHVFSSNSGSTQIVCDLRAYQPNSLSFQSQRLTRNLSGGRVGTPAKHMFDFRGPVRQTPGGPYEVVCSLPAGTGVASYSVTE